MMGGPCLVPSTKLGVFSKGLSWWKCFSLNEGQRWELFIPNVDDEISQFSEGKAYGNQVSTSEQ